MVQRCWNKGPLGPSIPWGCFVLYYFDEEDEVVEELKRRFGAVEMEADEVKVDFDRVEQKRALVWCWG